jgi:glucose/arabinose dehydrogenase/type 1 glutamine amidotransferase
MDSTDQDETADARGGQSNANQRRRQFLKGVGALGTVGVAGCLGDGDTDTPSTDTPSGGNGDTDTPSGGNGDTDTPSGGNGNGSTDTPTPDPQADISITGTTIRDDAVSLGEPLEVEVVLGNAGDADGTVGLSLGIDGTTVAEDSVDVPAGEEVQHAFTYELPESGTFTVTVNGEEIGEVTVEFVSGKTFNLLVLSVTKGFRHGSIENGNDTLQSIVDDIGEEIDEAVTVEFIDNDGSRAVDGFQEEIPSTKEAFDAYDAVVFQNTTGSVLDVDQQDAFRAYVEGGGGWMGIHAGVDTHKNWDWYDQELAAATFDGHPAVQEGEIHVTDRTHPSTRHLPARWTRTDEWYDFNRNPRGNTHVLATLDERTYDGANMNGGFGRDHPIAWCHEVGKGRSLYTAGGHTSAAFDEPDFREHLKGGLLWVAGYVLGDASGTVWDAYGTETVVQAGTDRYDAPMKMDISADNRLFYTELGGSLNLVDIDTGTETEILSLDVYTGEEDGLQGVALDPDFQNNGHVYLYHAPTDVPDVETGVNHFESETGVNRISRFTVDGNSIDPGTEVQILDVVTQRHTCCHAGGDLEFDTEGNLYLTTGDDTNPFDSLGFTPIDERDGREPWDAQRSSANTDDLRGSVVRINPNDDGSYEIPDGNLRSVTDTPENVRSELYAIGMRNPFTAAVDPETDTLFLADYGPDSRNWSADRGPAGSTEYAKVDEPGFYGWPYFTGHSVPYRDYDFDTGASGDIFDPDNPTNGSVNNSGLENLPAVEGTMIMSPFDWTDYLNYPSEWEEYVPYSSVEEVPFPQVTGGGPMVGIVFRSDPGHGDVSPPDSYDGKVFMMEYNQGHVKYATLDDDGEVMEVDPFLPDRSFSQPFDMAVGPDGAVYLMERGRGTVTRFTAQSPTTTGDLSAPYGLNCGGVETGGTVEIDGLTFENTPGPEVAVNGADSFSTETEDFDNTGNDLLYQTELFGLDISFDIGIDSGTYDVTLHFAEIWWGSNNPAGEGGVDSRVFDVSVQGETVLEGFDIYDEVGANAAITEVVTGVEVDDGTLTISGTAQADSAKFSGIEIRES